MVEAKKDLFHIDLKVKNMTNKKFLSNTSVVEKMISSILGFILGDALGVPVEFVSRQDLKENPITTMNGYGSHNQPVGTWSDDTSMVLCTIESLIQFNKYNSIIEIPEDKFLIMLSENFLNWFDNAHWTPHGEVFDFGRATGLSMHKLRIGVHPFESGDSSEYSNGNGSLMRILPFVFYMNNYLDINARYESIKKISSITHSHILSIMACFYYVEYGKLLLDGKSKLDAYKILKTKLKDFFKNQNIDENEINKFSRILDNDIYTLNEDEILTDGYVIHSLEACLWCFLNTKSYKDAVLKAVNLGIDSDTIAALTGGLAGIIYDINKIPEEWISQIVDIKNITNLIMQFDFSKRNYEKLFSTY